VYEPGSTFKLVTSAMALELGTVNLSSGFDASRPIRFGRFTINDFRGKNRWLSLPEIIAYSSNLGTAHMAMTVGRCATASSWSAWACSPARASSCRRPRCLWPRRAPRGARSTP
jgi:cell division protein FtsI/penicillin-binding protein 2